MATVHLDWSPTGSLRTACGRRLTGNARNTLDPAEVTCRRCPSSFRYRMAEARGQTPPGSLTQLGEVFGTPHVREAKRLRQVWEDAYTTSQRSADPSDSMILAEQQAYDALVEYVDAHDLTYTDHDPRGPEKSTEEYDAAELRGPR